MIKSGLFWTWPKWLAAAIEWKILHGKTLRPVAHLFWQILELTKTLGEVTVKEIEASTSANRNYDQSTFTKANKR